jgi:Fic family protein
VIGRKAMAHRKWNWQQNSWPQFTLKKNSLLELESLFLKSSGILVGTLKHLKKEDQDTLKVELLSDEALKTSEIEGEILNRESLQSSIRRQFGLATDRRTIPPAEQGIAEMMIDLYKTFAQPLTHESLFLWHQKLCKGRKGLKRVGAYRSHTDPMRVVSGYVHKPKIHFEAPPSKVMKPEMKQFIKWFNASAPDGDHILPALIRSGMAHLYFVSIHPFEDGNGRIGRAISEKVLSQCLGQPTLIALAQTTEAQKKSYYNALEQNNKSMEITPWLFYFGKTILDSMDYTQKRIEFLIEKTKFYDQFKGQMNFRQEQVIARMFKEGIEGFKGGLSAENYIRITKTSKATATRDLQDLVRKGAFTKTGELKYTRYALNIKVSTAHLF